MWQFSNYSIRDRLWAALAVLTIATLVVGSIAWYSLGQINDRLDTLHSQTVSEVARAIRLSRQSSKVATTAPFLLNFPSVFLIEREGAELSQSLANTINNWSADSSPDLRQQIEATESFLPSLVSIKAASEDLVIVAILLKRDLEATKQFIRDIRLFEAEFSKLSNDTTRTQFERQGWIALSALSNTLLNAAHAENLMSVGEYRRSFQAQLVLPEILDLQQEQSSRLSTLKKLADPKSGLFEHRRSELSKNLVAQNALFRIKSNASRISELTDEFASEAEKFLSDERVAASATISLARYIIFAAVVGSVLIAIISAAFVSGYVARNIGTISNALVKLADGNHDAEITQSVNSNDEIGKLFRSFRIFRENAQKHERRNRQLQRTNALIENVFSNISDGVAITDANGCITTANPSLRKILGRPTGSNLTGEALVETIRSSGFAEPSNLAQDDPFAKLPVSELVREDTILEVRSDRIPDGGLVWLFADVTERRKLEERIQKIKHIEGLGKVSGEVAHDFGNILSSISANAEVALRHTKDETATNVIERIAGSVEHGTALVQRLLAFAKKQALSPEPVEINQLVEGIVELIAIGLKKGVNLTTNLLDNEAWVNVDPGQLESALFNVCLNSNYAISASGEITISLVQLSQGRIEILVEDNGQGMGEETLSRVFEPFFSTRADTSGTGLGLAMVYGFIKQSGGDIDVQSQLGQGTVVTLTLPLCARPNLNHNEVLRPRLHAVVIEDERDTAELARAMLLQQGYGAQIFASADEALEFVRNADHLDLVLSDLNLEDGPKGVEVVSQCQLLFPNILAIVMSGRLPEPRSKLIPLDVGRIAKPLTDEKLCLELNRLNSIE